MAEFKSGEIVLLKCGGPEMVVDSADFDHVYRNVSSHLRQKVDLFLCSVTARLSSSVARHD